MYICLYSYIYIYIYIFIYLYFNHSVYSIQIYIIQAIYLYHHERESVGRKRGHEKVAMSTTIENATSYTAKNELYIQPQKVKIPIPDLAVTYLSL